MAHLVTVKIEKSEKLRNQEAYLLKRFYYCSNRETTYILYMIKDDSLLRKLNCHPNN